MKKVFLIIVHVRNENRQNNDLLKLKCIQRLVQQKHCITLLLKMSTAPKLFFFLCALKSALFLHWYWSVVLDVNWEVHNCPSDLASWLNSLFTITAQCRCALPLFGLASSVFILNAYQCTSGKDMRTAHRGNISPGKQQCKTYYWEIPV